MKKPMDDKIRDALEIIDIQRERDEQLAIEFLNALWPDRPLEPDSYGVVELTGGRLGVSANNRSVCMCYVKKGRVVVAAADRTTEFATVDEATTAVAMLIAAARSYAANKAETSAMIG